MKRGRETEQSGGSNNSALSKFMWAINLVGETNEHRALKLVCWYTLAFFPYIIAFAYDIVLRKLNNYTLLTLNDQYSLFEYTIPVRKYLIRENLNYKYSIHDETTNKRNMQCMAKIFHIYICRLIISIRPRY